MKNFKFLRGGIVLLLSLSFFNLNAQFKCGNEEPASIALPPEYTDDIGPCFDIQTVKDECITIYLNVNCTI